MTGCAGGYCMQGGVAKTARIGGCYKNCRTCLQSEERLLYCALFGDGGIAQLGERLHGMQEVSGSIPLTSTKNEDVVQFAVPKSPSSRGLGHRPFTAITGVRIPVGTPYKATQPLGCEANPTSVGESQCVVVVQLVRIPACHAGGRGFESRPLRQFYPEPCSGLFRESRSGTVAVSLNGSYNRRLVVGV